jgi:hypothetical protein
MLQAVCRGVHSRTGRIKCGQNTVFQFRDLVIYLPGRNLELPLRWGSCPGESQYSAVTTVQRMADKAVYVLQVFFNKSFAPHIRSAKVFEQVPQGDSMG